MKKGFYVGLVVVLVAAFILNLRKIEQPKKPEAAITKNSATILNQYVLEFYAMLPNDVYFCGEQLILDENKKQKLAKVIADEVEHYNPEAIKKLADENLWFTYIDKEPKSADFPDDLRYVPLAESTFQVDADSSKVVGPWQFTKDTAERFQLRVEPQNNYDERYDFIKSTDAARKYLKELHDKFKDWSVALAEYNTGEKNLQTATDKDNTKDFYQLVSIEEETKKFPFRVLAAKMIFTNPKIYNPVLKNIWTGSSKFNGYYITPIELEVKVQSPITRIVEELKKDYPSLNDEGFIRYNRHIRGALPPGNYTVYIVQNQNGTS
jgi:hypothetical protein